MRMLAAIAMASVMMVSNAFAAADNTASADNNGPLAPGKPAGLHDAQIETGGVLLVLGIVAAAAGIAAIASTTQGHGSSTAATTTTH